MLTKNQLDDIRQRGQKPDGDWIKVGMSTCGIAAGAQQTFETLRNQVKQKNLPVRVERCGCAGQCYAEPLVEVAVNGVPQVVYGRVDVETAVKIIEQHVIGKSLVSEHIYSVK
jgi:NADP-reducing hydrogenase subunit HndB